MPNVTMPDGTVVAMPDVLSPEQATRLRALRDQHAAGVDTNAGKAQIERPPITDLREPGTFAPGSDPNVRAPAQAPGADTPTTTNLSAGDTLASMGKGIVGLAEQVPAGIGAGLGSLNDTFYGSDPGTHTGPDILKPHTDAGKQIQQGMGAFIKQGLDKIPSSPLADTLKERIPQFLGAAGIVAPAIAGTSGALESSIAGGGGEAAAEAAAARSAAPAPGTVAHPLQRAVDKGFQVAPNDVPGGSGTPLSDVPGSSWQHFTETPTSKAERQHGNVTQATQIASRDIGVPETNVILPEHIAEAKVAPSATYTRTGELIPKVENAADQTKAALQAVLDEDRPQFQASAAVRKDAQRQLAGLESGQTSGTQLMKDIQFFRDDGSPASIKAARALESEMENQLTAQNPKGLADYQAARQQFAKIYDVEASLKNGRLDPQALAARAAEEGHPGMTGGLEDIRNAATAAPNSVRLPGVVEAGHTPHSRTGAVADVLKAGLRKVAPDLGAPDRQGAIAGAAGGPIQVPVTGPHQSGAALPSQPRLPMGPGGPRDVLEAPPGQVTPGATVLPPRPDFQFGAGTPGPYTPPLERGPDGNLRPADRLPQSGGTGPVYEPMQRGAQVPQSTSQLNLGDQVIRQLRMAQESGVRSAPRKADIRGDGPNPLPAQATPGRGASAPGSLHGYGEPASEGMRPALLRQFIEAIMRHGR